MPNVKQQPVRSQSLDFTGVPWLSVQQAAAALEFAGLPSQGHGIGVSLLARILWRSDDLLQRVEAIRMVMAKAAVLN
jgi:hypothetical protein